MYKRQGHFVKMVHNGIEYGMMAAFAEGLNIIKSANIGKMKRDEDAETTPLRHPELYQYDMDMPEVAEVWRRGSVIGSWPVSYTHLSGFSRKAAAVRSRSHEPITLPRRQTSATSGMSMSY